MGRYWGHAWSPGSGPRGGHPRRSAVGISLGGAGADEATGSDRARPDRHQAGPLLLRLHHRRHRHPNVPADEALDGPRALDRARPGVHDRAGLGDPGTRPHPRRLLGTRHHLFRRRVPFVLRSLLVRHQQFRDRPGHQQDAGSGQPRLRLGRPRHGAAVQPGRQLQRDRPRDRLRRRPAVAGVRLVLGRHQDAPPRPGDRPAVAEPTRRSTRSPPAAAPPSRAPRSPGTASTTTCSSASTSAAGA